MYLKKEEDMGWVCFTKYVQYFSVACECEYHVFHTCTCMCKTRYIKENH